MKKTTLKFMAISALLGAAMLPVQGCTLEEPHGLYDTRLQAVKGFEEELIPLSSLNTQEIRARANHYERYSNGPMLITVTFNPNSNYISASKARVRMDDLVRAFKKQGVGAIRADLLPVNDWSDDIKVMISYETVRATSPKGCQEPMPGLHGTNIDGSVTYKLGCGTDTIFARQIAKPRHLIGNDDHGKDTEGRRAANIIEGYRTGEPNSPLGGESASGN